MIESYTDSKAQLDSIQKIVQQRLVTSKWLDKSELREKRRRQQQQQQQHRSSERVVELETLIQVNPTESSGALEHIVIKTPQQIPTLEGSANAESKSLNHRVPIRERVTKALKNVYIDPFGKAYYPWLIITTISYMYNLVFLIARSAFWLLDHTSTQSMVWSALDYSLSDLVYACDILVKFLTGYMENGLVCFEHVKIAKRYVRTFEFKIDLLSLLPTDLIYYFYDYNSSSSLSSSSSGGSWRQRRELLAALRLNRLLKFSRLVEFRSITETETKYPTAFRMSNLLINILLAMHWNACLYFIVSRWTGFGNDEWVFPELVDRDLTNSSSSQIDNNVLLTAHLDVQYIYCFWWSVQTLTTVAEVPAPTNPLQKMYMSVLLMMGVIVLAITIGSAGDMVENANREKLDLQAKCDDAKSFLMQNKIGGQLEQRIKNYLDYLWIAKDVRSANVLKTLPDNLRKEIAMNVHIETLKKVHVFQDCESGLLEELVTKLTLQIYSPGDYVCRKGDVGHEMYFIKTGSLQVVSPDGSKVFATLVAGAAFGEISILDIPGNKNGNKRTANIRSLGFSDVFQLSKDDLWEALSEYPVAKKTLLEKGKALLKKDNLLDLELAEKIERAQKPLHEQVSEMRTNRLVRCAQRLDDVAKSYNEVLKESKQLLFEMEKKTPTIT